MHGIKMNSTRTLFCHRRPKIWRHFTRVSEKVFWETKKVFIISILFVFFSYTTRLNMFCRGNKKKIPYFPHEIWKSIKKKLISFSLIFFVAKKLWYVHLTCFSYFFALFRGKIRVQVVSWKWQTDIILI